MNLKRKNMNTINIKAYITDSAKIEAIKSAFKDLKIKIEISEVSEPESPYNKNFVDMILDGEAEIEKGNGIEISPDELEDLCK